MKKILSLILACGLICSALFAFTGCSEGNGSSGSSNKYQEIFDHINDCDVESSGSSQRILQTNFYIKNWLKDNRDVVSQSNLVSGSDAGSELSKYIENFKDKQKTEFGIKCQAVIDAELKLDSSYNRSRSESWGADVQDYSDTDIARFNDFFESLQDALSAENIKPAAEYPYLDQEGEFDEAFFLDLISSMSNIETATAGSSYQLDLDTADFMQFVIENANCDEGEMKSDVKKCYDMLSPSNKLAFDWNFPDVIGNIYTLIDEPRIITDMGKSVAIDDFSQGKLDKLVNIISEVSGVSYTN